MKIYFSLLLGSVLAIPSLCLAQNYTIDWYTIDGGGGTSSGGNYTVSGTIGQPDAGTLAGGNFSLQGGFWAGVFAVQQVGSPILFITRVGTQVQVSWDPNTPNFVLQQAVNLTTSGWTNVAGASNGSLLNVDGPTRFYRLRRP